MIDRNLNSRLMLGHHRVVARLLKRDTGLIGDARAVVDGWKEHAADQPFVGPWECLLSGSVAALRRTIVAHGAEAEMLRRASPFALVPSLILDHQRVRKLWRVVLGHATRILPRAEYPKLARHLKRLNETDRFHRFWQMVRDDWIDRYVAGISPDDAVIGHYGADLELDGAIHVGLIERGGERYVEIGVSVLPEARHHGIGYHLLHRAALWARNHDARCLYVVCQANNSEMIKLANEHRIEVHRGRGDAEGVMVFQPSDRASVAQELLENQIGEWDLAAKAHDTAYAFAGGAIPDSAAEFERGRLDKLASLGRVDVLSAYLIVLRYALLMQSDVSPRIYRSHLAAMRSGLAPKLAPYPAARTYIMGLPTDTGGAATNPACRGLRPARLVGDGGTPSDAGAIRPDLLKYAPDHPI